MPRPTLPYFASRLTRPRLTPHTSHLASPRLAQDELPNGLAFGGNIEARFFGLWLRDDLESGRSEASCSTYGSPRLASAAEFAVDDVELWAVAADPPPPTEEEAAAAAGENALTAAGVLSTKHADARAFVQLAGRGPKVANSGGSAG